MKKICILTSIIFYFLVNNSFASSDKCYGFNICHTSKNIYEISLPISFLSSKEVYGRSYTGLAGIAYNYNINFYLAFHNELDIGFTPVKVLSDGLGDFIKNIIDGNILYQVSATFYSGMKLYPFKKGLYLGGGLGAGYSRILNSSFLEKLDISANSFVPFYYLSTGISFNMKKVIFDIGVRFKKSMIKSYLTVNYVLTTSSKVSTGIDWTMGITIPFGRSLHKIFRGKG